MIEYPRYRVRRTTQTSFKAGAPPSDPPLPFSVGALLELQAICVESCRFAADRLNDLYHSCFDVAAELKEDATPVTEADRLVDELLKSELGRRTPYPVVTEESQRTSGERAEMSTYWLVDPLDGTQNYLNRDGEFSILAALVSGSRPVIGVIAVPAKGILYYAARSRGAFKCAGGSTEPIRHPLPARVLKVVDSKLPSIEGRRRAERFCRDNSVPEEQLFRLGSAYKLGELAAGAFDIALRFDRMSEWDIAAPDCILQEAGCFVVDIETNESIRYNQRHTLSMRGFLAARADLEFNVKQ